MMSATPKRRIASFIAVPSKTVDLLDFVADRQDASCTLVGLARQEEHTLQRLCDELRERDSG